MIGISFFAKVIGISFYYLTNFKSRTKILNVTKPREPKVYYPLIMVL